ncbi:hypothetical protein D9M71_13700 [compost metagenome]
MFFPFIVVFMMLRNLRRDIVVTVFSLMLETEHGYFDELKALIGEFDHHRKPPIFVR